MSSGSDIMLLQFRVRNYLSIRDEIVLDMTATKLSDHPDSVIYKNKVGILPVAALFGGNAAGKSNVIAALIFMVHKVQSSHLEDDSTFFSYATPFAFSADNKQDPTEMEIFFAIENKEYKYGFIIQKNEVLEEWLYSRKLSKNETVWKGIYERDRQNIKFASNKKYSGLNNYSSFILNTMLILTFFGKKDIKQTVELTNVYKWFEELWFTYSPSNNVKEYLSGYTIDNGEFANRCTLFLKEFDPTIEKFEVKEETDLSGKKSYKAFVYHFGIPIPLSLESQGTDKIISLFLNMWVVLYSGGIWIVDELDTQLHPLLLRKIVRLFQDHESNPHNAQLVFTSHNLIVLDRRELRRDQVWFVEKDCTGQTSICSLAEYKVDQKTVRADLDYGKAYLAGRFGAVPFQEEEC